MPAGAGRELTVLAAARERQRLADRMHDDVAPLLLAAQLRLAVALEHTGALPEVARIVERAQALIVECDARIRRVVAVLDGDPGNPAASSLEQRLGALVADLEERFGLVVGLHFDARVDTSRPALTDAQSAVVVAAVREGVVNAARHARAARVVVVVARPRSRCLRVTVENPLVFAAGVGGPGVGGHGLRTLRRAVAVHGGAVALTVVPSRSATLTVELPLLDRAAGGAELAAAD